MKPLKSKLLWGYASYYILVFLLPFSVLAIIFYQTSMSGVSETFQMQVASDMGQVQRQWEENLSRLRGIGHHISVEPALTPFNLEDPFFSRQGISILSSYVTAHESLKELVLHYFTGTERFYTSRGLMGIEVIHETFFEDTDMDLDTLAVYFQSPKPVLRRLETATGFTLQYFFPLHGTFRTHHGTVVFLLDTQALSRIHDTTLQGHPFFIVNEMGEVLLGNDDAFVEAGKLAIDLESSQIRSGGITYQIAKSASEEFGLQFVTLINVEALIPFFAETRHFILTTLLLLLGLGISGAAFASWRQYKPIKTLHSSLGIKGGSRDELSGIRETVSRITTENEQLKQMDEVSAILTLLEGGAEENSPFLDNLKASGKSFMMALVKRETLSHLEESELLQQFPVATEEFEMQIFQIPLQKKLGILMVSYGDSVGLKERFETWASSLSQIPTFYVGQKVTELAKISHSYVEAVIACDYLVEGDNPIVCYRAEDILYEKFFQYPKELETKLLHSILQGVGDVAMDSLRDLFAYLKENRRFESEIRLYAYYIIKILMVTAADLGISKESLNLKAIMEFQVLEELEGKLMDVIGKITAHVHEKRETTRSKISEEVFETIKNEFTSPDMTLDYLAEKFDYSLSYLSKMLKEELGVTFTHYLQELRMEYIKKALVETDIPIKELVQMAGYFDTSNFTRKFKSKLGITPGQYRELNRVRSDESSQPY